MSSLPPTSSPSTTFSLPTSSSPNPHQQPQLSSHPLSQSSSSSSSSDEDTDAAPAPLPSFLFKPKDITARHALKKSTGSSGGRSSLIAQVARKRAESLESKKWSKYEGGGVFELNLAPEELRRA